MQIQIETLSDLAGFVDGNGVCTCIAAHLTWLLLAAVALAAAITFLQKSLEPRIRAGAQRQVAVDQTISSRVVEDYGLYAYCIAAASWLLPISAYRLDGRDGSCFPWTGETPCSAGADRFVSSDLGGVGNR